MRSIRFWNGNKSTARQAYETQLLEACLKAAEGADPYRLEVDNTDLPSAADEGAVFERGADVLVTVAGNVKFAGRRKRIIHEPLAKGLLGHRILVVREDRLDAFAKVGTGTDLRRFSIGIPETWADAELFRQNRYPVVEKGGFEDLFPQLKSGVVDYTALGANEIESIYSSMAQPLGGLTIEPHLMLVYPFPLVFYVHPGREDLATRLEVGLKGIRQSGEFDELFNQHYGGIVERLNLRKRVCLKLCNQALPEEMENFSPELI